MKISRLLLITPLLLPMMSGAAQLEGRMTGLNCVLNEIVCPIDKGDPHLALEPDFVVAMPDGNYYLLPNVDRAVKSRVALEQVVITGEVSPKYKSIAAEILQVRRDGELQTVWSREQQEAERRRLFQDADGWQHK